MPLNKKLIRLTYTQYIALGFLFLILTGSLLLTLPFMNRSGQWTPFLDALFTATSATCVTGLVVHDTYTYWNTAGQLVILLLIQIGGVGFMTVIALFSLIARRQITLHERKLLMQSAGAIKVGGIVQLVKQILLVTLCIEGAGTLLLATRFCRDPKLGFGRGLYFSLFHSISAFCNAGFDLMGAKEKYSSLTSYMMDPVVNFTVIILIILGGLGFIIWNDLGRNKWHFQRYALHTKLGLTATAILIVGGTILFFIFEFSRTQSGMNLGQRLMVSLFDAITPRTAGFNTSDMTHFSDSSIMLTIVLMFIRANPGSTAGGIKTTTLLVLILSISATCNHSSSISIFKRKLEDNIVRQAAAIATIYLFAIFFCSMIICAIEPYSMKEVLFETTSAAGTVGLTLGITPFLGTVTRLLLILLMYGGRIGGLTLALVLAER
ncbi:MAG TPA: potassium transporter TrkG, partial [Lachnospiraceae bacterium]|nr:potassium transporter TrkG [Lachnospiraceae bacterium]